MLSVHAPICVLQRGQALQERQVVTKGYLTVFPQFCREELNDNAWYPGFTDWDLIRRVPDGRRARFTPLAGYYDFSASDAISKQFAAIANSRWQGMALYHYFFDGRFVLDAVEKFILSGGSPVPEFFVVWANETWTKRWVGRPREIIVPQLHSTDDEIIARHVDRLVKLMRHPQYRSLDGRPLFVLYSAYEIPSAREFIAAYRAAFRMHGVDPLIGFCVSYIDDRFDAGAFDFCVEFQPRLFFNVMRAKTQTWVATWGLALKRQFPTLFESITGVRDRWNRSRAAPSRSFKYGDYLALAESDEFARRLEEAFHLPVARSAFYSWNNFPRYRGSALEVLHEEGDVARFNALCTRMSSQPMPYLVNSWNEWSEGAALEPGILAAERFERRL
jgi:hypothetical protein